MHTPTILTALLSTALIAGCDLPTDLGKPAGESSTSIGGPGPVGPGHTSTGIGTSAATTSSEATPDTDTDGEPSPATSTAAPATDGGVDTDEAPDEAPEEAPDEDDSTSTTGDMDGASDESGPTLVPQGQCPVALDHTLRPDYTAVVYHGRVHLPGFGPVGEEDDLVLVLFGGELEDECSVPEQASRTCGKEYLAYAILHPGFQNYGFILLVEPGDEDAGTIGVVSEVQYFAELEEDFCCMQGGLQAGGMLEIDSIDESGISGRFELHSGIFGTTLEGSFDARDCGVAPPPPPPYPWYE